MAVRTTDNRKAWRERAACRDVEPETFFPTATTGPARDAEVAEAKAVCARCPVRAECLTEALARIPYGIAGGLTEDERRQLRSIARTGSHGLSARAREVLSDGPSRGMSDEERAGVGRELLAAGRPPRQVAATCRVSERTAERWAAGSSTSTNDTGERSRGGNRAPLRISTAHDAPGRDTSTERTRA